ncbi:hypothetical protein EV356DRAFT_532912 [Viridothelium virens]|uniref:Uncharacterized protein n=1 Tax=Viridothelium virens TaxID=1048519 RepID=A0A6A6H896_VIRVR|nr:hypothetical protein EV356DRAFT_532912 [Viridothelium virens]
MPNRTDYEWKKRFLIPFWILELFWAIIDTAATAVVLTVVDDDSNQIDSILEDNGNGDVVGTYKKPLIAASAVLLVFYAVIILLTVVEMILYCVHRLKPVLFLVFNVYKVTFWLVLLIMTIVNVVREDYDQPAAIISTIIFLCFVGPLIYGAIIYHHFRRSGPQTAGLGRTYTALGRQGPGAGSEGVSRLNPFNDSSYETRSTYSSTSFRNESATEMGVMPGTSSPRYGNSGPPAAAVGAVSRADSRAESHGGSANEYYEPYAPDRIGGYESYRAPPAAASASQHKGQDDELGYGIGEVVSQSRARGREDVI